MKLATVHYKIQDEKAQCILLENMDDLYEYQEYLNGEVETTMVRLLKSNERPDRWDHLCRGAGHGDSVMLHSITRCTIRGGENPLLQAPHLAQQKIDGMIKTIKRGNKVIVNSRGGWCDISDTITLEHIDEYEFQDDNSQYYHIGNPTMAINLENDPVLEKRTKDYFKEINDTDPSYIVNLRQFSKDDLVDIFNQFHENGGDHVFVYTTGLDTDQMYDYSEAVIESKIKKVVFEFNAGYSEEHHNIVDYLQYHGINVTVEEF